MKPPRDRAWRRATNKKHQGDDSAKKYNYWARRLHFRYCETYEDRPLKDYKAGLRRRIRR